MQTVAEKPPGPMTTAAAIAWPPLPLPLLLLLLLSLLLQQQQQQTASASAADDAEEKVCDSVAVRNTGDRLYALENCTVVNGYVHIVLLDDTRPSDFEVSFPKLREITQYLVVYRVSGLASLGRLFPNLALIRGVRSADFPGLSLMIHDNPDLVEVGLHSLTNITQGSVIITNNPSEYTRNGNTTSVQSVADNVSRLICNHGGAQVSHPSVGLFLFERLLEIQL